MQIIKRKSVWALIVALLVSIGVISQTGDRIIGLAWSPVAHDNPISYEVGFGTASRIYDTIKTVSSGEDYTIAGLECRTYYSAVRACDTVTGECSPWSEDEVVGFPSRNGQLCSVPSSPVNVHRTDLPQ